MRREIHARGFRCAIDLDTESIAANAAAARDRATAQVGEYIRAQSAAIAPRRTGQLAASAQVESVAGKVTVRYGTAYAAIQHEHTEFRHPGGGQTKFLQSVVENPATAQLAERALADALSGALN